MYVMYDECNITFVPFTVWLFDNRNNKSDPNIRVFNSYEYTDYLLMREIVTMICNYTINVSIVSKVSWDMSKYDMMKEWDAHNISYTFHINRNSAKDVDFNMNENRQWYFSIVTHIFGFDYYYCFD